MKSKLPFVLTLALLSTAACDKKPKDDADPPKPAVPAAGQSAEPKTEPAAAKPAEEKLDTNALEAVADAVKFEQAGATAKGFNGKLTNTSQHAISMLEYKAFAYDKSGKLIESIAGKYSKALDAGKSADLEVGPFTKAAGKPDVTVEVVVSWMNVNGTSFQRPVPKDRAKGGPNNALKK
jgi:hypothetical protein